MTVQADSPWKDVCQHKLDLVFALLWRELEQQDKEENMAFVSWPERRGIEKGIEKGLRQSLSSFLKQRHKEQSPELLALLDAIRDDSRLAALCDEVFAAEGVVGVRAALLSAAEAKP